MSETGSKIDVRGSSASRGFAPLAYRRPALFALGAICAGIILGQYNIFSPWVWLATAILAAIIAGVTLSGAAVSGTRLKLGLALTLFGLLSLLAYRVVYSRSGAAKNHILRSVDDGARYRIYGFINDWPDIRERATRLTVRVDSTARMVAPGRYGKSVRRSGSILVFINTQTTGFQYADQIIFDGEFARAPEKKNPGGFDYARYLRWKDIFALVYLPHHFGVTRNPETGFSVSGATRVVREYILSLFHRTLQEQPAALASGFLIGETSGISDDIYRQFRRSGTLHLLAVSGSNVAVALLVLRLFLWPFPLGRRTRYFILILGALFFSFLSHNDPSVVRASVMITLFLIGRSFERRIDYHNLIASSGALILLWSPNQLFDVGFQLSFIVTWALILFLPPWHQLCERWRRAFWYKFFALPLIIAFVAQLSSGPVALYYFGSTPLNATISNLIIGPAVGIAVAVSLITLGAAALLPLLGTFAGTILNVWLQGILLALQRLGGPEAWQLRAGDFSAFYAIAALAFVFLLGASLTIRRARRLALFALTLTPTILLAPRVFSPDQPSVTTTVLATRGGVCALINGPIPTLIVSDLVEDPVRQYQYLFGPALRRAVAGIGRTKKIQLAQLSADHLTLVNALTLCDSFPQSTLYLTSRAKRLYRDHRTQFGIPPDRYSLQFSTEIDPATIAQALRQTADTGSGVALLVGASLALQFSSGIRILHLSLTPDEAELRHVIRVLQESSPGGALSHSETELIIVVDRLDSWLSPLLEDLSQTVKLRIISGHRNQRLHLSADFAQLISYVSESGAVTIVSK